MGADLGQPGRALPHCAGGMGPAFGLRGPCQQPEHETEERQVPPGAPGSAPAVNQGWPRLVCGSNPNPDRLERLDVRVRGLALSFSAGLANSGASPAWSRHLVSTERAGGPGTAKPEELELSITSPEYLPPFRNGRGCLGLGGTWREMRV